MNANLNTKVKPLFNCLKGYYETAPESGYCRHPPIWENYNKTIDELNNITSVNYDRFKITNIRDDAGDQVVDVNEYRQKLLGLVKYLEGEYDFFEETKSSSGVIFNNNQTQNLHLTIVLEFQTLVDKKLYGSKLDEQEKGYLEKIKELLPGIKSITEIVNLILSLGKTMGLTLDQITKLFT
ncbi:MAG: hypothetical protein WAV41_03005 [Microgenomates group bacterium]